MGGVSFTHFVRRRRLVVTLGFATVGVLGATLVLWLRQTSDALLRVGSFQGGLMQVAFFALPTIALYVLLARTPAMAVVGGVALIALLVTGWWGYATDWHSTAAIGPASSGWFLGPAIALCAGLLTLRR